MPPICLGRHPRADYLAARPDVDPGKLACTGTSGGGLQTELLSAVDRRIKVSIPVCYGGCAPDTPLVVA
jgi:dienelactone hydrolase